MSDLAIKLSGVSKRYKLYNSPGDRVKEALNFFGRKYHKDFHALRNINLDVKKGEILGIVGKNGCGKSTLLKLISKVLIPSEGNISVDGKVSALLELGAGFNPEFTGLQNVFFHGAILGFSESEMLEKVDDILEFAEIGDFIHQPLKTYSSGMKSRLGFAVAVHVEPDILILDEVLSVGDALFRRKCHARMQEYFDSGKTVIYVSHDIESINSICTRAVLLHEGSLLLDSNVKTVTTMYHKYLFSDEHNKTNMLKNLVSMSDEVDENSNNNNFNEKSHMIEGFVPKSTVSYKNYNVDISNCKIVGDDGIAVNSLVIGNKYYFEFNVRFHEEFNFVKFGCNIKNEKGVVLSGLTMPSKLRSLDSVFSGYEYEISAGFKCDISAGNYFFDVGVTSDISNEKVYLNMIHDVLVFKVQASDCNYWGLVNLWYDSCVLKVK